MLYKHPAPACMGIYKIVNTTNEKCYVGSALNIRKRWHIHKYHLANGTHHSAKLQRAYTKYEICSFKFELIEEVFDQNKLLDREQYWIDLLDSFHRGYNTLPYARNAAGIKRSDEQKVAASKVHKELEQKRIDAGIPHPLKDKSKSEATKERMSQGRLQKEAERRAAGIIHPNKGRKHTQDAIEKTRKANTGRKFTDEHKEKLRQAKLGTKMSEEAKEKGVKARKLTNAVKREAGIPYHTSTKPRKKKDDTNV